MLSLLRRLLDGVLDALPPTALVGFRPTIHFRSELEACPFCGNHLKVKRTTAGRLVHTLHIGDFLVHETSLGCESCDNRRIYRSEELGRLFPEKCDFGYDVIIRVGRRLFLDNRIVGDVQTELAAQNVTMSESDVSFLGDKFIDHLVVAHRQTASRLRQAMGRNGGHILHIDATCDGGGPMLISGMDAIASTILWNRKIPTEKADHVVVFLKEINELYGPFLLVAMDMSKGFGNAVREVFGENMRILICHFHFLRDVGKDLLGKDYDMIRKRLRKHKASPQLRYRTRPFQAVVDENPDTLAKLDPESAAELTDDERRVMPTLAAYSPVQWVLDGKGVGDEPVEKIESRVADFRDAALKNRKMKNVDEHKKMIAQIDKYWNNLFADPVALDTPDGTVSIQPQRTNNVMEQFFRSVRRGHRRRTGNDSMKAKFEAMKANTVLVKNFENKRYLDILLNGKFT